jgi:hypothetical protein
MLLIDSSMRSELLVEANTLMRGFLLRRQIEAVKSTFQLVPMDTISILIDQWKARTGLTDLPPEVQSSIREYVCVKAYLDALDAFNDWFTRFHHSKPKKTAIQQPQRDLMRQNAQLRQTCVPHAALLLSNVLFSTQQHEKCLELVNVIAAEPQALHKVCSTEQLNQLIKHI